MCLRSFRERVIQTITFEIGGILIVSPLFAIAFGATTTEAFSAIIALSIAAMIWSPLYNTGFDWADLRLTGRLASDRPQAMRIMHAMGHEVLLMVVTLPLLMHMTGLSFIDALFADIAFTVFYTLYAYVFHLAYDHLRPVQTPQAELAPWRGQAPKLPSQMPVAG